MSEDFENWFTNVFEKSHRIGAKNTLEICWNAATKALQAKSTTRFNEGLQLGLSETKKGVAELSKARDRFLNENENLTNLMLELEAKLDEKDEELANLRKFARLMLDIDFDGSRNVNQSIKNAAQKYKLIDAGGKPAPLLNGEKID